jgi:DNA-binding GntR family transcriptional regulator
MTPASLARAARGGVARAVPEPLPFGTMPRRTAPRGDRPAPASEPSDLPTMVYDQLRQLIVLGRLSPGGRISENELAARLGVSRTPIRGALQRLRQEGLVVALEGGKLMRLAVAPLTREDAHELLNLLGALEGVAARWIAGMDEKLRRGVAAELRGVNRELARVVGAENADPEEVFRIHSLFHTTQVEAVPAPRLIASYRTIWPQAERYRRAYVTGAPTGLQQEVAEHDAIIRCLEQGDADGAQLAVQGNWARSAERLQSVIDRSGARGDW